MADKYFGVTVPQARGNPQWVVERLSQGIKAGQQIAIVTRNPHRIVALMDVYFPMSGSYDSRKDEYAFIGGVTVRFLHPRRISSDCNEAFDRVIVDKGIVGVPYFRQRLTKVYPYPYPKDISDGDN